MEPHISVLVIGTLLEAFGALLYIMGGVHANVGLVLIVAGICADSIGIMLWLKARRLIQL